MLQTVRRNGPYHRDFQDGFEQCINRAEVLEARLTELHDAVEGAIERLHAIGDGEVEAEDGLQVAIAELNKVL